MVCTASTFTVAYSIFFVTYELLSATFSFANSAFLDRNAQIILFFFHRRWRRWCGGLNLWHYIIVKDELLHHHVLLHESPKWGLGIQDIT